jgi:L-rhamnose mutarotase
MEEQYEQAHRVIPVQLRRALLDAGVTSWRIWRSGRDLFHVVECDSRARLESSMANSTANARWQVFINQFLEVTAFDSTPARSMGLVWELEQRDASP